ncbi:hypothetical protein CDN99_03765 [Roseateles aquatilis]|uniref:Glycosyltransferase subfamily 4-like N-terminal domain-containing protein n=1 Tax=Roseateles aquatilis TaxID=431061 RepID=A0A246JN31_9BURK|nr:glycosyltransferase [Roseateles aquatilis]OWQ93589.1 hypothetical protein CDN99_03765 [Roseateles aquatilis]
MTGPHVMTGTPRILFVTPVAPFPADSGGAQRSFLLYQALRRLGEVDTVLVSARRPTDEALAVLRRDFGLKEIVEPHPGTFTLRRLDFGYGPIAVNVLRLTRWLLGSRTTLFRSRRMAARLGAVIDQGRYDFAVGRYLWPLVQADVPARLPTWLDVDDLESEVWQSRADEAGPGWLQAYYRRIAASYEQAQRALLRRMAGGWVAKARDARRLARPDLRELPNIPFANYPAPAEPLRHVAGDDGKLHVIGVAAFDYRPNLLGFDWFVTRVWPRLRERFPRAQLDLVGKLVDADVAARWAAVPGVVLHGRVPELPPYYERALFAVAPIFQGGGTNIKVIEALVYGRCCVVTPHAAKGFEGLEGLFEAADEDSFARQCADLLAAPQAGLDLGRHGARSAGERFSFQGFARAVEAVLTTAATSTQGGMSASAPQAASAGASTPPAGTAAATTATPSATTSAASASLGDPA